MKNMDRSGRTFLATQSDLIKQEADQIIKAPHHLPPALSANCLGLLRN